ncbi:MAG: hypothetical protein HW416_1839 [Chloroflexi bacterium]|nr:hypothetical protein [Chloroflexota bacterium]
MRVLGGRADRNLRFVEITGLLLRLGFDERIHGSHHIFTRTGIEEIINLQPGDGGHAKPYQVRQVRAIILRYRLAGEDPS